MIGTSWQEGAYSQQFRALGQTLAARGHRVVIVVDRLNREPENHHSNPAVYTWPSLRPTRSSDAKFLWHIILERRPACVIGNFGSVNLMVILAWCFRVKRRIVWCHTLSTQVDQDTDLPAWRLAWLRWRKRRVYRLATNFVGVSREAARDLQTVFGVPESRCKVFHNMLLDPCPGQQIRKTLSGQYQMVCTGRFDRCKGQDVLIRALALLRRELPDARVEFLGEGPTRPACEKLAAELGVAAACRFAGAVDHATVLKAMSLADVTVVPSRSEAFGLVAVESLAVGTPVVASAVGGLTEIVRDGLEGRLVPSDNAAALANCLRIVLAAPEDYSRMSAQARRRFLEAFEQRQAIEAQADWLESLVSSSAVA